MGKIALAVEQGMPLPAMAVSEVIATAVMRIVFIPIALWPFQRVEL